MQPVHAMRDLAAGDIIRIWERGQGQDPLERALTILAVAFPDTSRDELASLSLGRRNARLLQLRERLFGQQLKGFAECPPCQARLEFALDAAALWGDGLPEPEKEDYDLAAGGFDLRFRLPNTQDLAALATCPDLESARERLVQRCVMRASHQGVAISSVELPEEVIAGLAAQLAERDPLADAQLDLECPACGHRWQAGFDIGSFLWTELSAQAKRLLLEVHTLARAYGWREADILSLSAARRRFYLDLVM